MSQKEFLTRPPASKDRYPWVIIGYVAVAGIFAEYVDSFTTDSLIIISTAALLAGIYDVVGSLHDSLLERIVRELREPGSVLQLDE